MKTIWLIVLLLVGGIIDGSAQPDYSGFKELIERFKENNWRNDTIKLPVITNRGEYSVQIAEHTLGFEKKEIAIANPFGLGQYPISYSLIFNDRLVALFEPGNFACFKLETFDRDTQFEAKLNTHRWESCLLFEDKLVTSHEGKNYAFSTETGWSVLGDTIYFNNQPEPRKLFEDDRYFIYTTCNGEFGGVVFFHSKTSGKTHIIQSVCAVAVIKQFDSYQILSSLGHGFGSADLQTISNPETMPEFTYGKTTKDQIPGFQGVFNRDSGKVLEVGGVRDTTNQLVTVFDFYGMQIFSGFKWKQKTVYMPYWRKSTFLATIDGDVVTVVDPLFNDKFYTHNPITTQYSSDQVLINLDFYGDGGNREVSCIVIDKDTLTKINWK